MPAPAPPYYVGIDLAWGEKKPTGVAVLDGAGRLLRLATVTDDDAIVEQLAGYVDGPCVVAIDAPLVVTNATGNRPAERELNRDFQAFEAGAHPSNTGKPEFADGTRGARVAKRLGGLDLNPRSGRDRRAVEVYPHAASVALFSLPRTLKYKNKPGRDLELLRSELLVLMTRLEGVVEVDDTWRGLRADVEVATRKSQLRVVEDQVDAVVCAYVALFAARRPEAMTTYGDAATGAILTPTLPEGLVPGPRAPRVRADPMVAAVRDYAAQRPVLEQAGEQALALVTSILDEAGINYLTVTGRTKTVASYAEKAGRTRDGVRIHPDPARDIGDQLGLRVITYVQSDVDAVADLLSDQVVVLDDRDMGRETAREGRFGYASRHLMIGLDAAREGKAEFAAFRGRTAQVQVRTVLQHAWAEFEHDIRYKGEVPDEHAPEFDRRFTLAAGLLELADQEFAMIRERLRGATVPSTGAPVVRGDLPEADERIAPRELAAFLAGQYADAGWSRTEHYDWISGLLRDLEITTLADLAEVLRRTDEDQTLARMDYRYPPGAVRRLDDALLAEYAAAYVDLPDNAHRRDLLTARLARLQGG